VAVANEQRTVLNEAEFAEGRAAARPIGAPQRKQLSSAPNQNCPRLFVP
jgi:hypothetical protein